MEEEEGFSEALIEAVRRHPTLWNKKIPAFARKNSDKILDWQEVAQSCGCEVQVAKDAWKKIRDYYMSRRRLKVPSGSAASAAVCHQLGPHGRQLNFLEPSTERGPTTSSITFRQSSNPGPVLAPPSPAPVQEGDVLFLEEAGFEVVVGLGEEDTDHHNLITQDTQHAPRTHSTPHSPDTQNTQDAPRAHNTQEPQNAQEGQDTQNTQGPSRTQNTQGPPRAPGTQGPPRAPGTQGPSRAPGTQQAPHAQDAPRARYTNMHDTQIPSASTTVPDTPSAPRPRSRTTKRKTADATDEAIMEELARGRKRDSDRDYTFCMNLYAELQHRSEPVKRIIKREIQQTLDVHDE